MILLSLKTEVSEDELEQTAELQNDGLPDSKCVFTCERVVGCKHAVPKQEG